MLQFVKKHYADAVDIMEKMRLLSIIEEDGEKRVNMANLAVVGSHTVNGVARLHSELVKKDLFAQFYALWPEKFQNKTNGITPRRWLMLCNPMLSDVISEKIGDNWITHLDELQALKKWADDETFQREVMRVKQDNKMRYIICKVHLISNFFTAYMLSNGWQICFLNSRIIAKKHLYILQGRTNSLHADNIALNRPMCILGQSKPFMPVMRSG